MKKILNHTIIPSFILVSTIILGVICVYAKNFEPLFLVTLCLFFVLAILYRNNFNKTLVTIARTLVGALFLFSGFVKGVDPLGTQYQIFDYFAAYGTVWANPLSMPLALILIATEFVVGAALILNIRIPFMAWITVLMMAFFTVTTLLDATIYSDKITDCGCFGKAITLTNWQTFYKNIVLNILVVILFFGRYRIRNTFSLKDEVLIVVVTAVLFFGFQFYNLRHLPVIDFMDWKKGAKLNPPRTEPVTYLFQYKNKETQEIHEFDSKNLPADIATNWEFVDMQINDPNPPNLMIPIFDQNNEYGQDVANFVASFPDYVFIVAIYDVQKANLKNMKKIFALQDFARENGYMFMFLFDLNVTGEAVEKFKQKVGRSDLDIFYSDDKSIKAIVRSNPGLILLKNGVVVDKWAWRDVPSVEKLQKITL
ncbi:MAG: DoxX family protein [Bacteroidales bacterium]|jgi:uncharacterized membrane protein YphA (DoxX/SURF4 family)|nr:DoxX family protein [Bacteroidales bacterium]